MKKKEIQIGAVYGNGKGRYRRVLAIGNQYKLYPTQMDDHTLQYETLQNPTQRNGPRGNITVAGFAQWAKEKIRIE